MTLLLSLSLGCGPTYEPAYDVPCVDGFAGEFPCEDIDLLALLPNSMFRSKGVTDLWGWTDPDSGAEIVTAGLREGTAIIDATNPTDPTILGVLPSHNGTNGWRDVQVVDGYAFVVAEERGHGMQVLELAGLLGGAGGSGDDLVLLEADALYEGFGSGHNIVSLAERGVVWAASTDTCEEGLHGVDVSDPLNPRFTNCWQEAGAVHDAQCVVYQGPDPDYAGRDVCLAMTPEDEGGDEMHIVDVTDPTSPQTISGASFPDHAYSHQGWLTEDHRYFLANDEYDEINGGNTRTIFFDVQDLDAPEYIGAFEDDTVSISHDAYTHEGRLYQANYSTGLHIMEIVDPASQDLQRVGHFDTWPADDETSFMGAWGVYPYFESGAVAVTSKSEGVFLLRPALP